MQGDYFSYATQAMGYPQQTGYTQYACAAYPSNVMPTLSNIALDKFKKKNKSISGVREFSEGFGTQSTDESIHLVRSRKSGADSRYETNQMMKKRSQSGTSIMKGMASQLSIPRSQSDERSVSPSLINEKRKTRKDKRSSKNKGSFISKFDEDEFTYSTDNRLIDAGYLMDNQSHYHQQHQFFQPMQYGNQCPQQYQADPYHQQYYQQQQQQPQHYNSAPGAPVDYYNQSNTQNFQSSNNPSQSYYPSTDCYSQTQTFAQQDSSTNQNLPNGAKIVAEYFLGYLDEQQQYQQQYQQQQQCQQQTQYPVQYHQSYDSQCPPGCVPAPQPACPQGCVPEGEYSDDNATNEEEVEIEIWEKAKKDKKSKHHKSLDDFKKLTDIIEVLEKKLGNLKADGCAEPIQPIFLMPKQSEAAQSKPIYVPRNIYVPVIRPVFVPRERVIVRPQIIHVARPVLVDRPVPIQQRPLVIERDRPVPVRVETIERTENAGEPTQEEPCVDKPGITETTYHEFTQDNYPRSSSVADINEENDAKSDDETVNKNKQLVLDLLEEAERRKKSLDSKSHETFQHSSGSVSKNLDSVPYNTGYTLEVLDQRVSDKFERVDEETIKARYGVESFQYLPAESTNIRSSHGSFKSLNNDQSEIVTSSNGNLSTILTEMAKISK